MKQVSNKCPQYPNSFEGKDGDKLLITKTPLTNQLLAYMLCHSIHTRLRRDPCVDRYRCFIVIV